MSDENQDGEGQVMSFYEDIPEFRITRSGNGWRFVVEEPFNTRNGVSEDGHCPLVLRAYIPGLARYAKLTLELEEP